MNYDSAHSGALDETFGDAEPVHEPTGAAVRLAAPPQDAAPRDAQPKDTGFGFRLVFPLALGTALNPVNSSMVATALVPIAAAFGSSAAEVSWLIAVLYLSSAIAQPAMGQLSDLYGAKRIYLLSLLIVAVSGLLGAVAPTLLVLIVARVFIGIGTSGGYPASMTIFRAEGDRLGGPPPRTAMGMLSLAALSTTAVGPFIGGLLVDSFGWHAVFLVNLPVAALAGLMIWLWTPTDPPERRTGGRIDLIGMALFAGTLLSLMGLLMNLDDPNWLLLPAIPVFGVLLVWHSLRQAQPFLDIRLMTGNIALTLTYLRTGLLMMTAFCLFFGITQWVQGAGGLSAAQAGLVTLPASIAGAVAALLGARTRGIRGPFLLAAACSLGGSLGLMMVDSQTPVWIVSAIATLFGFPIGLTSTAGQAAIYVQAPADRMGTAAGLQRTALYLGAIASAALIGAVYGSHPTDAGFHLLMTVMAGIAAAVLLMITFDRTLPRGELAAPGKP